MDAEDRLEPEQLEMLGRVFAEQLLACLAECARGRRGLFGDVSLEDERAAWLEAARLRELAVALQAISHQAEEPNALCDEFLDLCTMHGESHPGEPRLAREFLARIERGDVGAPTQAESRPW